MRELFMCVCVCVGCWESENLDRCSLEFVKYNILYLSQISISGDNYKQAQRILRQ